MKQNRFIIFTKIFTIAIIFGAVLSLVACNSDKSVDVESISVSSLDGSSTITSYQGTLLMVAEVLPEDASNLYIVWSVQNGTGEATITPGGTLKAVSDGTVTVKATSVSNDTVFGTKVITISNQHVLAESIAISSAGDAVVIATFGGTLQMSAVVLPANTIDKSFVWSVENGTGEATISDKGLLTAVANGTVTVKVVSNSNALVFDTMEITLSNQEVVAESVTISSVGDAEVIATFGGTLQMSAVVLPANTYDKSVVWSVENGTGEATISSAGLLTAVANGTVIVKVAVANNALIFDEMEITMSNQEVLISSISVFGASNATTITTFGGTLQMSANILPANAEDQTIVWSVENGTGEATINANGLLTAVANGTVIVTATSTNQPTMMGSRTITISNQEVLVTSVTVSGENDAVVINTLGGTLQMFAEVLPVNAAEKSVVWSVENGTCEATISAAGLLTAVENGTVTVKATSVDSTNTVGSLVITISNQEVLVVSVTVSGENDAVVINTLGGTLQMIAVVMPLNAADKSVVWSVENGTGEATISAAGLLTAASNGTVTVKATSVENSEIFGTYVVTISNQEVLVESIIVSGENDAVAINTFGGTLQMTAEVLPMDAFNKSVVWSVENGTGEATISSAGLLTAVANGTVTVKATSVENSEIFGTLEITISNQEVLATSIIVTSEDASAVIDVEGGTLQMYAEVLPVNADDKMYTWSLVNGTGEATLSSNGLLTALVNGTVTVYATLDSDPLIVGSMVITISNQPVIVSEGVDLLSAEDFTILSKTGISTTVGTHITGNLGVSPGPASYITGFDLILDASGEYSTSSLVTGMIYASDYAVPTPSYLSTAISDMEAAYTDAAGRAPDFIELHAGDISGQTLVPGVYYWSSGLLITTDVTLSGSDTDVWIFQIAGTLTQSAGASILLEGGALVKNIVWQVASEVSIGVGAHFEGTILGMTSVDLGTNASYNGKIFAQTAVTLDSNDIN